MSKKLICLILSFILIMSVLVGCSQKSDADAAGDISDAASESAVTLAMYLMSEKAVSAETAAKIEAAVNEITQAKFKTKLKLYFYTEDVYYTKLEEAFDARAEAKANGTLLSSQTTKTEDGEEETMVNEYGVVEIKYPEIASYQVDLFYLGGKDNYDKYKAANMLTRLDEELNSSSKELKKYIPNQILSSMKSVNGGTYALPSNHAVGEYTYLLLNKVVLEKTHRNEADSSQYLTKYSSLTSTDSQVLLEQVTSEAIGLTGSYYPLYTNLTQKELLFTNLHFWGVDENGDLSDAFSVLGDYFANTDEYLSYNTYPAIANLFENEQFTADLEALKQYEVNGYYGSENETRKFAVGYVQGGAELAELYGEDYIMIPVAAPRLDEEDLYNDMFAVCSYSSSSSRSMKILTYLNTDETFRNLLLYGIEGEHYQYQTTEYEDAMGDSYQVVQRLNEDYMMSAAKTGNVLIAYPTVDQLPIIHEYAVLQNQDALAKLTLGYTPGYNGFKVDAESLQRVRTLSAEIWADYLACDSMEAFAAFLTEAKAKVAASEDVQKHIDYDHGTTTDGKENACDGSCGSLQCSYQAWLKKNKIISG